MTSKPLSIEQLIERTLVSHEYNDVTGTVTVNVTDALLAIANAINRLASTQDRQLDLQAQAMAQARQQSDQVMMMMTGSDRPGHA